MKMGKNKSYQRPQWDKFLVRKKEKKTYNNLVESFILILYVFIYFCMVCKLAFKFEVDKFINKTLNKVLTRILQSNNGTKHIYNNSKIRVLIR